MINVLFSARQNRWEQYEVPLLKAFSDLGIQANLSTDIPDEAADYIIYAPNGPHSDFSPFTRCKAVLNLWAGVEDVVDNETLKMPLARMVDHGLTQGMVEWVTGHALRHHLGIDLHTGGQDGLWRSYVPPLAQHRKVTVLGLGALGLACANSLAQIGFDVTGWSRSPKSATNITCLNGEKNLNIALENAEIVILLLPLTASTENIINEETLSLLADQAVVINPGRGPLIDDDALLAALDYGRLGHATLDVFRTEPLPKEHPFWNHPNVTVTPHIASETRKETASEVIAENIRRGEAGEPFLHLVDRKAGY